MAALGVVSCSEQDPSSPDLAALLPLEFRAGVDVRESLPVQLGFRLEAENTGDEDIDLLTDACGLQVRAYREPERTGTPAWSHGDLSGPCLARTTLTSVPAGGKTGWKSVHTGAEVLGDSLPEGRYYFTTGLLRVGLSGAGSFQPVEVPSGDALLP